MQPRELLKALQIAERLKETTRHCYGANGRQESVAEHSWLMSLIAFLIKDEFPEANMHKVIEMCIIHDLGEAFTGDIPTFCKTEKDDMKEETLLLQWVHSLPKNQAEEMLSLYHEMKQQQTIESKIYKAIDSLEALIQHNISDLSTWSSNEYELNKTYADDRVGFSAYLTQLRQEIRKDTLEKLQQEKR